MPDSSPALNLEQVAGLLRAVPRALRAEAEALGNLGATAFGCRTYAASARGGLRGLSAEGGERSARLSIGWGAASRRATPR